MKELIQGGLLGLIIVIAIFLTLYLRWGHI